MPLSPSCSQIPGTDTVALFRSLFFPFKLAWGTVPVWPDWLMTPLQWLTSQSMVNSFVAPGTLGTLPTTFILFPLFFTLLQREKFELTFLLYFSLMESCSCILISAATSLSWWFDCGSQWTLGMSEFVLLSITGWSPASACGSLSPPCWCRAVSIREAQCMLVLLMIICCIGVSVHLIFSVL